MRPNCALEGSTRRLSGPPRRRQQSASGRTSCVVDQSASPHKHTCLAFVMPAGQRRPWVFLGGRNATTTTSHEPTGPLEATFGDALVHAAVAGAGIVQALDFMAADALARGEVHEVLRDFAAAGPPVYAVCLPGRQGTPRVRAILTALADAFRRHDAPT